MLRYISPGTSPAESYRPFCPTRYEVCSVCYRLGDLVAFYVPGCESECNHLSLREARLSLPALGAISSDAI